MASIQGIYIALFGRPADPLGLEFFNEATSEGADLTAIGDLSASAEYQTRFEGMDNASIVTEIYQSLFGRNPEQAGLSFFVNALSSGSLSINNIAIAILDGAQGDDLATVTNKISAADAFTAAIDTPDELAAYRGDVAAQLGRDFLSPITADEATVPTAEEVADAVAGVTTGEGTEGQIFTLTNDTVVSTGGVDTVTGTTGDDTIRAVTADSLGSADIINGGAGFDTLTIVDGGLDGDSAPVISGVERINNDDNGNILGLASVTGVQQVWSTNTTGEYTDASQATIFGAENDAATTVTVGYSGSAAAASLAVAMDGADATFEFGGDAATIKTVNLLVADGNDGAVNLDADLDALETVVVTGAGEVEVITAEATLVTFDASANTGGVTFDASAATALEVLKGGSGSDSLTIGDAQSGLVVTLGAGNDTLVTGVLANITDADEADFAADIIEITDFNGTDDLLDVSALGARVVLNNVQLGAAADADSLFDAIDSVDGLVAGGGYVTFVWEGSTYLYVDDAGTADFSAGDGLVKLTGFTGTLDASNFVA